MCPTTHCSAQAPAEHHSTPHLTREHLHYTVLHHTTREHSGKYGEYSAYLKRVALPKPGAVGNVYSEPSVSVSPLS